ncbi:MAG TPA: transposase [Terriglobia bacterium]|nr:transposase [Terriglobia bacterium]
MNFGPPHHHRRSIRLRGYDYSLPGTYYVTICIENKQPILGKITEDEMMLYEAGQIAKRAWEMLPQRLSSVALDAFVVMRNHVHGIIRIERRTPVVGAPLGISEPNPIRAQQAAPLQTLGDIVRVFKSTSAISINRLLGRSGRRVWQRNYYEHIVRSWEELEKIRGYIAENPLRWAADRENPGWQGTDDFALPWET